MRGLVSLCVRRRVSVIMATLAIVAFGLVGYSRLAVELFPDISYPSLTVQVDFPDTAPQEVETLVTRPVEEAVGVLRGLNRVHSVSRPGLSEVTLEFGWDSDMDLLSMEVREALDRLILPDGAEDPVVLRYDPSLDPVVRLALTGGDDLGAVRQLAELRLKPDLETVKGIAAAEVKGGLEEEIVVDVDQERLAALGLPMDRVRDVVGRSNLNLPGGALRGRENQYLLRTVNEYDSVEEIGELIVWQGEAGVVRLRDVADVRRGHKEREVITRVGGVESVEISIFKEGDANTVQAADALHVELDQWRNDLPEGYELTVLFDQAVFVKQAIRGVLEAALYGGALAIVILLLFLRDPRSTLVVALSIPVSVVATFLLMYRGDISLNVMSLGGLTLGIGMLVDNSIVVLESVHRRRKAGLSRAAAAVEGTAEVGGAVVASTLTTVAVFLPLVFVEGIGGQLFRDQALTVTFSLLASLVVATTLLPTLLGMGGGRAGAAAAPVVAQGQRLGRASELYDRLLRSALRRPAVVLLVAFVLFGLSVYTLRGLGSELLPPLEEGEFAIELELPEGSSLPATDRLVSAVEQAAMELPQAKVVYSTVGSRLVSGGLSLNTEAPNLGQVNVVLDPDAGEQAEATAVAAIRERFADTPEAELRFAQPGAFSLKTPVEVIVYGEDLEELRRVSQGLARTLASKRGLVDVRTSLEAGNPELQVHFDRDRLAALGLDLATLSQTLRDRVQGAVPTRFKEADRQIDVRVRNAEADRASVDDVRQLVLEGPGGQPIRLLSVAEVRTDRGPAEIHRVQQQRAAVVTADLRGRSLGDAMGDVQEAITEAGLAPSRVEMGGQAEEMGRSFSSLLFALGLAVFLVYLVMAATFESFVHPFVVLFTIPLALVGVVPALALTGTPLSVVVFIGAILLAGIVVNNAIVLLDTVRQLRVSGLGREEALVEAGHTRLRPILMTTLTTVLGLLPMALLGGEGAELRQPLAITVASGLLLGTFLTLVVIPSAYQLLPAGIDGPLGGERA